MRLVTPTTRPMTPWMAFARYDTASVGSEIWIGCQNLPFESNAVKAFKTSTVPSVICPNLAPLITRVNVTIQILEDRSDLSLTKDLLLMLCHLTYDVPPQDLGDNENGDFGESTIVTSSCLTTDGVIDALSQAAEIKVIEKVEFDVEARDVIKGDSVFNVIGRWLDTSFECRMARTKSFGL